LGKEFIEHELPQEAKLAKLYEGVDPIHELIPIKPSAHYTMGGILVDADAQTNIAGLFAVGECANQRVHGANRLGGNSLLELVVFGKKAGERAAYYAKEAILFVNSSNQKEFWEAKINEIKNYTNKINFYQTHQELGEIFYKSVGILREENSMQEAVAKVKEMQSRVPKMGVGDKAKEYNTNLTEFLEFANMLELSELILLCALERKESRGAHFRVDAPQSEMRFEANSLIGKDRAVRYEN